MMLILFFLPTNFQGSISFVSIFSMVCESNEPDKEITYYILISLGPHCEYFRMRILKPQVAKISTVASVMRDK